MKPSELGKWDTLSSARNEQIISRAVLSPKRMEEAFFCRRLVNHEETGILIPKYSESWNKFRELGGFDY